MKCRSCPPYQRSKPLVIPRQYWDQIFPSVMGGTGGCDSWNPLIRKPRMSGAPGPPFSELNLVHQIVVNGGCKVRVLATVVSPGSLRIDVARTTVFCRRFRPCPSSPNLSNFKKSILYQDCNSSARDNGSLLSLWSRKLGIRR